MWPDSGPQRVGLTTSIARISASPHSTRRGSLPRPALRHSATRNHKPDADLPAVTALIRRAAALCQGDICGPFEVRAGQQAAAPATSANGTTTIAEARQRLSICCRTSVTRRGSDDVTRTRSDARTAAGALLVVDHRQAVVHVDCVEIADRHAVAETEAAVSASLNSASHGRRGAGGNASVVTLTQPPQRPRIEKSASHPSPWWPTGLDANDTNHAVAASAPTIK